MVDPFNITDYNRTYEELEEFFFFCVFVAGKNAVQTAKKTQQFYELYRMGSVDPLEISRQTKLGKYTTLDRFFQKYLKERPDLYTVPLDELLSYPGIGPKTARFFILHSRPDVRVAVLDTHILKYLRELKVIPVKTALSNSNYRTTEKVFLHMYDRYAEPGQSVADFDLELWKHYRSL